MNAHVLAVGESPGGVGSAHDLPRELSHLEILTGG